MALATHANPVKLYCVICKKLPQYAIGQYAAYGVTYTSRRGASLDLPISLRSHFRYAVRVLRLPSVRASLAKSEACIRFRSRTSRARAAPAPRPPPLAGATIRLTFRNEFGNSTPHAGTGRGRAGPRPRNSYSRIVDVDPYYHVYYTFNSRSVRHSSQGRRVHMQTPTMKTLRALIDLAISRCNI